MTERDIPLEAADDEAALHVMDACIEARRTNALGHLRAAEYVALFDDAIMRFFAIAGLTGPDLKHRGHTTPFLMDLHATYLRELGAGDQVAITVQVLDVDARRARIFLQMHKQDALDAARDSHSTERYGKRESAATCELALINMDIASRRPTPWSREQAETWDRLKVAHAGLGMPPQAGRAIGALTKPSI